MKRRYLNPRRGGLDARGLGQETASCRRVERAALACARTSATPRRARAPAAHGWTADRRDRARGREAPVPRAFAPAPDRRRKRAAGRRERERDATRTTRGTAARPGTGPGGGASGGDFRRSSVRRPVRAAASRGAGVRAEPARPDAGRLVGAGAAADSAPRVPRARSHWHPAPVRRPQTESRASGWEARSRRRRRRRRLGSPSPVRRRSRVAHGAFGRRARARGAHPAARARAFQRHARRATVPPRRARRRRRAPGCGTPTRCRPRPGPATRCGSHCGGARGGAARGLGGSGREWATTTMGDVSRGGISRSPRPSSRWRATPRVTARAAPGGGAADASALTAAAAARFDAAQSSWSRRGRTRAARSRARRKTPTAGAGWRATRTDTTTETRRRARRRARRLPRRATVSSRVTSLLTGPCGSTRTERDAPRSVYALGNAGMVAVLPPRSAPAAGGGAARRAVRALAEMLACGWRYPGPSAEHARAERWRRRRAPRRRAPRRRGTRRRGVGAPRRSAPSRTGTRASSSTRTRCGSKPRICAPRIKPRRAERRGHGVTAAGLRGRSPTSRGPRPGRLLPPPGGHGNLLANLFSGGGGQAGGALPPPRRGVSPPTSRVDGRRRRPPAPRPGSFDAAPRGGAPGGDAGSGGYRAGLGAQQPPRRLRCSPRRPAQPAWGGARRPRRRNRWRRSSARRRSARRRAGARRRRAPRRTRAGGGGGPATAWGGGAAADPSGADPGGGAQAQAPRAAARSSRRNSSGTRSAGAVRARRRLGGRRRRRCALARRASARRGTDFIGFQGRQQHPQAGGGFWTRSQVPGAPVLFGGAPGRRRRSGSGSRLGRADELAGVRRRRTSAAEKEKGDFKAFCRAEMRALNDSDDLTLVTSCFRCRAQAR